MSLRALAIPLSRFASVMSSAEVELRLEWLQALARGIDRNKSTPCFDFGGRLGLELRLRRKKLVSFTLCTVALN
jgi:hypothetical protein